MENIIWLVNNKEIIDLFVKKFFFLRDNNFIDWVWIY